MIASLYHRASGVAMEADFTTLASTSNLRNRTDVEDSKWESLWIQPDALQLSVPGKRRVVHQVTNIYGCTVGEIPFPQRNLDSRVATVEGVQVHGDEYH